MTQRYDRKFKINAVNLYNSNDKSIEETAKDFEVSRASLGKWGQEYKVNGQKSFPGSGKSVDQELHDLRRKLHMVRQEREILKKAVAIFPKHATEIPIHERLELTILCGRNGMYFRC